MIQNQKYKRMNSFLNKPKKFPGSFRSITVREPTHSRHYPEHVVVGCVDTHLGGRSTLNRGVRENELEGGIVNAREVAGARWLVLLRAESKRVDVDAGVWGAGVAEEGLDKVEVRAFTLRETVLAVELELGSDDWVLAPTVEAEGSLGEDEGASIRHVGFRSRTHSGLRHEVRLSVVRGRTSHVPNVVTRNVYIRIDCTSVLEEAIRGDEIEVVGATLASLTSDGVRTTERVDRIREGIDRIGVVEWLGTKHAVENGVRLKGGTVVHVRVWLDDPDEFLDGVVKVKLDLVGGRADRLIARKLELINEVLVGVLGHTAALIRVEEHVVHEEGSRYE